ncbi:hypothetical protein BHE74_00056754 [Ensete ventricosum]|nr:hypothetical protein BHE74_00056754 [Ensete ventricosum]
MGPLMIKSMPDRDSLKSIVYKESLSESPLVPYPRVAFIHAHRRLTVPRSLMSSVSFVEVMHSLAWPHGLRASCMYLIISFMGFVSSSSSSSSDINCAKLTEGVMRGSDTWWVTG